MKQILLVCLMLGVGCATIPFSEGDQQSVIEFRGMKKADIFKKSLDWIATTFVSYKAVTEYTDQEAGKIVGNITTSMTHTAGLGYQTFRSRLIIEAKDGRARLSISCIGYTNNDAPGPGAFESVSLDHYTQSIASIEQSYIDFMTGKSSKSKSDW